MAIVLVILFIFYLVIFLIDFIAKIEGWQPTSNEKANKYLRWTVIAMVWAPLIITLIIFISLSVGEKDKNKN